jgi:hypothetical protein
MSSDNKHGCPHCLKKYTNKKDAQKHILMCEILSKTPRAIQIEEENTTGLPSHDELCFIVMELARKNRALELKLEQITNWAERQRKKISVTDWLNQNRQGPDVPNYASFKDTLSKTINQTHVEYLLSNTFIDTMLRIFSDTDCSALFSLANKPQLFYMYKSEGSEGSEATGTWVIMGRTDLVDLLNYVHSKFLRELIKWKKVNEEVVAKNEQVCKQYNKMMIKFSEIDFDHDATLCKMRSGIHALIKKDMKNMIEYEFS